MDRGSKRIKKTILIILTLIISLLIVQTASADTRVIINSGDWIDVYSGMLYASLNDYPSYFLTSPKHATILPFAIPLEVDEIQVITSRTSPYASGFKPLLEAKGYQDVVEFVPRNGNIEIGDRLPDITKFIVIDDSYGYNAVSVAPLAVIGKYYVLFADRTNIGQVSNFLQDRTIDELIIYGQVDREVKDELAQYNPETINTGDRFDNNIEVVKKYQEYHKTLKGGPRKQAILTNGEFLESSIMNGNDPVLFIGFSSVPDQVKEYIADSDLEVGTLVGNELIGTATYIRRQTGLSVFVKFGQGSRTPQNTISQVEDLDRFLIPRYGLNVDIAAITLNTATNKLEVTYQNKAPIASYIKLLSLTLTDSENTYTIPNDGNAIFIDGNNFKTVIYDLVDADGNQIQTVGDTLSAQITAIYGESAKSLEQTLTKEVSVSRISVIDGSNIEIIDAYFNKANGDFYIDLKNIGDVDSYVAVELLDIYVNGEYLIFSSDEIVKVNAGQTKRIVVKTTMAEEDIPENPEVVVKALFGEREAALTKTTQKTVELKLAAPDYTIYIVIILLIILLILIFTRKKCDSCGHKNVRGKKHCKKCGSNLRR